MTSLFLLIPLGLLLLAVAVGAFFWATRSGQFDDLDTPAWSVIMDDDSKPREPGTRSSKRDLTRDPTRNSDRDAGDDD